MPSLIGNKPNQVPTNGDLGTMAYREQTQFYDKAQVDALIPAPLTTEQVLSATAGASAGDVGTYGWFYITDYNVTITTGSTRAGSGLVWTALYVNTTSGGPWSVGGSGSPSGTWRCMGHINAFNNASLLGATLWLRIS